MSIKSIKEKLLLSSKKDEKWKKEAEFRIDNEEWLDISFSIAVKILSYMKENNINQKDLSEILNVSPQYISKLLKGKQALGLPAIGRMQKILKIKLIEVPREFNIDINLSCNIVIPKETNDVKIRQENIPYEKDFYTWTQVKNTLADC